MLIFSDMAPSHFLSAHFSPRLTHLRMAVPLQRQQRKRNARFCHGTNTSETISTESNMQERTLLTTEEAAAYMGIKKSYLHKLMMKKEIPFFKPNGKLCYFDLQDLDKWMRRIRIASYQETDSLAQSYIVRKDMLGK